MVNIASWFRGSPSPDASDDEIVELTEQFYVTLGASLARVRHNANGTSGKAAEDVAGLLKVTPRSWTRAYEVEQRLIPLYDDDTVAAELELRTLEATTVLRKDQAKHYEARLKALSTSKDANVSQQRRILLGRLVNDLQWRYTVNEARRRYSKRITSRAGALFVLALSAFTVAIGAKVFFGVKFSYEDLRLFLFAGLAGAWGATFSMLSSMRTRLEASSLDDLKLVRPWVMHFSRMLIGAGAACILYFFIFSGLLGGTAFPTLSRPQGNASDGLPDASFALLVVWCFIAGFSERLVPGILARTEERARSRDDARAASDRYRPTATRNGAGAVDQTQAVTKTDGAGGDGAAKKT